ncbi:RecX family transcriptional regulator [Sphingopyxis sp. MWB1]|uniref:RecX family transcriptional regulator n=1 Tax=Sphingopyxis sp. MWB1 TaxID=1537715 RepID=UPI001F4868A7|nr:RecX family transcriptional regulator [Sphingopyxis sp. MWB1]
MARYLHRKIYESEWVEDSDPMMAAEAAVDKMERLAFLDDRQYAAMRGSALTRRGLGPRRVEMQLRIDGIAQEDADEALATATAAANDAALRFARRRRLGPFAVSAPEDPARRERQVAAFVRAGHAPALARRILALAPGDESALETLDEDVSGD